MLSKQKIRRKLAQADFTDDVMFGLVMSQLEICRKFLKAVLPQHDFTKLKIVDQSHHQTDPRPSSPDQWSPSRHQHLDEEDGFKPSSSGRLLSAGDGKKSKGLSIFL